MEEINPPCPIIPEITEAEYDKVEYKIKSLGNSGILIENVKIANNSVIKTAEEEDRLMKKSFIKFAFVLVSDIFCSSMIIA